VKLNSVLRNTAPSAKPKTMSAAAAGWPSISTSAISSAVASAAAIRNGQSKPSAWRGSIAAAG
jgi:hypothetical protein